MDASILKTLITQKPKTYFKYTLDLSSAHNNAEIKIQGDVIYVDSMTINSVGDIRLNESDNDQISLKLGKTFSAPFYRIFLTNTAQAGCSAVLIIGISRELFYLSSSTPALLQLQWPTTPTIYNVVCTLAATEYSQALPASCLKFIIKARGGGLKVCFTTGETGTKYIYLADGQSYSEDNVNMLAQTLYFESPTPATVAEIIGWS